MYKVLYYDIYAKYYQSIKQYQQASAYIDTTLTMLKKDFTSDYAEQLLKQAKIWVEAGDNNRATTLYQQALAIKDSAAMALSNTQMEQIKKSYNLDKIELEQQPDRNQCHSDRIIYFPIPALQNPQSPEIFRERNTQSSGNGTGNQRNKKSLPVKHEL